MRLQLALLILGLFFSASLYAVRQAGNPHLEAETKARSVINQLPQIVFHCTHVKNPCHLGLKELETLSRIKFHFQLRSMTFMVALEKPTSYEFLTHTLVLNSFDLYTDQQVKTSAEILSLTLNTLASDAMEQDDIRYDFSYLHEENKSFAIPQTKLTVYSSQMTNSKNGQVVSQGLVLENEKSMDDLTQKMTEVLQCPQPRWKISHLVANKHRTGFNATIEWFCRLSRFKAELHVSRFTEEKIKLRIKRKIRFH